MHDSWLGPFWRFGYRFGPYVPFARLNVVLRSLHLETGSRTSILDVGCGKGELMTIIKKRWGGKILGIGADIFMPYLRDCRGASHDLAILCDASNLPFRDKCADVCLCLEVIEHLPKDVGLSLLANLERIARRQVILTTPVGESRQFRELVEENPYQDHKSAWNPDEFSTRGYRVIGIGPRAFVGEEGFTAKLPGSFKLLHFIVQLLTGPFTFYFPVLAGHIVATKILGEEKEA